MGDIRSIERKNDLETLRNFNKVQDDNRINDARIDTNGHN